MNEFTAKELRRVIGLLPDTDPRTPAYHDLLRSMEMLALSAEAIEAIMLEVDMVEQGIVKVEFAPFGKNDDGRETQDPTPEPDNVVPFQPVEEKPVEEKPAEELDLVTVRKAMKEAKHRGVDIVAAVQELGGRNLTDLSPDQWPALMKKLEGKE